MAHKNILIKGKVQGVGYRFQTREKAQGLGINGYVKNMNDGSVYIEAEGNDEQIEKLINWCKKGPGSANVENISIGDDKVKGFETFIIKQ